MVIDKLTHYVSQLATIASSAACTRQEAIQKECLSAFRRACGGANAAATEAGYILVAGQGVQSAPKIRATALIDAMQHGRQEPKEGSRDPKNRFWEHSSVVGGDRLIEGGKRERESERERERERER